MGMAGSYSAGWPNSIRPRFSHTAQLIAVLKEYASPLHNWAGGVIYYGGGAWTSGRAAICYGITAWNWPRAVPRSAHGVQISDGGASKSGKEGSKCGIGVRTCGVADPRWEGGLPRRVPPLRRWGVVVDWQGFRRKNNRHRISPMAVDGSSRVERWRDSNGSRFRSSGRGANDGKTFRKLRSKSLGTGDVYFPGRFERIVDREASDVSLGTRSKICV